MKQNMVETVRAHCHRAYEKIENSSPRVAWLALFLYIASLSILTCFHEPWFDEAQAWLIARDAGFWDILFKLPHSEGHPPLWHLYLSIFAKTGLPYEFGLKLAAILINSLAIGILIFKAPFPKTVRFALPFTYYLFYQYGVISRCYSFTILGFILMALFWRERDEKPFRCVLAMMLTCASTVYGIALCAGVSIAWLREILFHHRITFRGVLREKRYWALLLLLLFAMAMMLLVWPRADTFAGNLENKASFQLRLFYMAFLAPIDALFYMSVPGWFNLHDIKINPVLAITGTLLFALLASILTIIAKGFHKATLLVLPYFFIIALGACAYFSEHHLGIFAIFLLFWIWVCLDDAKRSCDFAFLERKLEKEALKELRYFLWMLAAFLIAVPLYWNVSANALDFRYNYCDGRAVADFIKKHRLEACSIMESWSDNTQYVNTNAPNINDQRGPVYAAYFDKNIIMNLNRGAEWPSYVNHQVPTVEEVDAEFKRWASLGAPDVLIVGSGKHSVFDSKVTLSNYTLVTEIQNGIIVKDFQFYPDTKAIGWTRIFLRTDLLDRYGLKALKK